MTRFWKLAVIVAFVLAVCAFVMRIPTQPLVHNPAPHHFDAVRVHDLRHTAITRMAEAGVPIAVIMSCAGHVSRKMTDHYTNVGEAAKRKAIMQAFERKPAAPVLTASEGAGARWQLQTRGNV